MTEIFNKYKLPFLLFGIIFSPYIFTSIRTDHLLLIILSLILLFRKIPFIFIKIFFLLIFMYVIIIISTIYHFLGGATLAPISPVLDSFEWYLRGAIIILFVSSLRNVEAKDIITLTKVFVFSGIFISSIALLQALKIDSNLLDNFLSLYEPGRAGERKLNNINYRYSSILGQPVSYGIYFLMCVSVLLFYGEKMIKTKIIRYLIFIFIFATSFLSVSKVVLIGIPILLSMRILLFFIGLVKLKFEDLLCIISLLSIGLYLTYENTYFLRESKIFAPEHLINSYGDFNSIFNIISNATSVRFGQERGMLVDDLSVFKENFLFGIGWSESGKGVHLSDSGYMPILVRSGLIGLFFYVIYLLAIFINSFISMRRNFGKKDPIAMNYLFLFFISLIFAIGSPIFYIDRASDFFWMISAVAILNRKARSHNEINRN